MDNFRFNGNDEKERVRITKRRVLVTASVIVFLFIALWVWKAVQIENIKASRNHEEARLRDSCIMVLRQSEMASLKLVAKPYVRLVREKMMNDKMDQINLYNNELARQKNILEVMVVDSKGIVASTSNKRNKGRGFVTMSSPYYLQTDSTVVQKTSDSTFIMASPVMGFDSRLGTVL
jgi:hypothetical protein